MSLLADEIKKGIEALKDTKADIGFNKDGLSTCLLAVAKVAVKEGRMDICDTINKMACAVVVMPTGSHWGRKDIISIYENLLALAEKDTIDNVTKAIDKLFEED